MPFTGTPVVKELTDGLVRITGVSVAGGDSGSIGLFESTLLGTGNVRLPAPFRPRDYEYPPRVLVGLPDSVQVTLIPQNQGAVEIPLAVGKGGTTPATFLITIANTTEGPRGVLGLAAAGMAVLAATAINNTGISALTGDLGVSPGATVTNFPPGTVSGTSHVADATAAAAQQGAKAAAQSLAALPPAHDLSGTDLATQNLAPGVYSFSGNALLGGTVTLTGGALAIWVFQIAGDFSGTATPTVTLAGGALASNVFWVVGGNVTMTAGAVMGGFIVATGNISFGAGGNSAGNLISLSGSVTLDTTDVQVPAIPEGEDPVTSGPLEIYVKFH